MISPFERKKKYLVKPLMGISMAKWLFAVFPIALYVIAIAFYSCYFFSIQDRMRASKGISVIEIVITVFSMVVSIIATVISDRYNGTCQNYIEKITRQNEPILKNDGLKDLAEKTISQFKRIRIVRRIILAVFIPYQGLTVMFYILNRYEAFQIIASVSGTLSGNISIVLAMSSAFSCIVLSIYMNKLFIHLLETVALLNDQKNSLEVERSHCDNWSSIEL